MGLNYPAEWKFDDIDCEIPSHAVGAFLKLVRKIATGHEEPQRIFEAFKSAFGRGSWSTNADWAATDLAGAMHEATGNAALFIDSFWTAIEELRDHREAVPSENRVNEILDEWKIPLVISPPDLLQKTSDVSFDAVDESKGDADSTVPYTLHEPPIGRGGFGVVHRVTRTTAVGEFEFAMKFLEPSVFNLEKERAAERFQKEIAAMQRLQHRGIVQYLEAGEAPNGKQYILMPLIHGQDVRTALSGAAVREVAAVFDRILEALSYAHSQQVVHRDIKPSNIRVRESDRQPIILDFGCAYFLDDIDQETLTTTQVGSLPYIPTEVQLNPKLRSVKQDVYACGILLYEVLGEAQPDVQDYDPIECLRDDCPGVDELIRAATAPHSKRLENAGSFRKRLSKLARGWRRKE